MRKFSKVVLVIAAAVGVVGIGLTIGGVSMGATITGLNLSKDGLGSAVRQTAKYVSFGDEDDWNQDWDEIDESDSKEAAGTNGEIYLVDGVSKLDLSIRTGELYLKEYNGNEIKVEVSGKHREKVRVGQEGDTLVLESIGRVQDREITVSYPKKMEFEDASVDVAAGTVNLDDDFYAKKLEVSVAAGEFTNDSTITAEKAELTVGTGNIDLENLKVQNLEADCGIGNIDLGIDGKEKDYDYEISCAAGAIDIGDSSFSGLGHEKKISNPGSSGKMTFDCGVGNITVDFE